jgi:Ca2+-transporting ATPase
VILVANGVFGFVQDYRAQTAIQALRELAAPEATVIREGAPHQIPSVEVVPGDILTFAQGDRIPADARLLDSVHFETDEAALTGESLPVAKSTERLPAELQIADRRNLVFSATSAVRGRATGIVVATGMNTEIGRIATLVQQVEDRKTPFQEEVDRLGHRIGLAVVGLIAIVAGILFLVADTPPLTVLLLAVTLAVAAVPEGLPAVVTLTLALGSKRMLRRRALVRRLPVAEGLGSIDVILSDKTGTLTESRMSVERLVAGGREARVEFPREGDRPVLRENGKEVDLRDFRQLLLCGGAANDVERTPAGEYLGDPTEVALRAVADRIGVSADFERLREVPFDSSRKRMTVVTDGAEPSIWMKGAPEVVLRSCNSVMVDGETLALDDDLRERILADDRRLASRAYRVLGFARREVEAGEIAEADDDVIESGLTFLGLQAMIDPTRPEVPGAIDDCRGAGIRVVMVTGDNIETARAIADELGLHTEGARTGAEIDSLPDPELQALAAGTDVFARVSPGHKVRILEALQREDHRVAMTGDGVNDAPALRAADVGVAMGLRGTDVAREAADLVLLDDDFTTIRDAVEEGRGIFDNIRNFVTFLLSANVGEVLIVFVGVLLGAFLFPETFRGNADALILTPAMLLWINLVTDGPPALALGVDPHSDDVMHRPPRSTEESVLDRPTSLLIGWIGVALTAVGLLLFFGVLSRTSDLVGARALLFTFIVTAEMGVLGVIRRRGGIPLFSNPWLFVAVASSLSLQLAVLYTPLSKPFGVRGLSPAEWLIVLVATALFVVLAWIGSRVVRR